MTETTQVSPPQSPLSLGTWRQRVLRLPAVARTVQTVIVVAASLRAESITLRAAALTYLTVLSLIPLLAVVFSIFQAVVGKDAVESQLQGWVFANLAVGLQDNVAHYISQYIQRASSFGAAGFALVLFSSVSLMGNVETALNQIFRATRPRPWALRLGVYWCVLTLGPILIALSLTGTALLQAHWLSFLGPLRHALLAIVPVLVTVATFTFVYLIVPAVRVQRRAAVLGALVAGLSWEAAKIAYAALSQRSARNGAIYGSLSAIPIFLVWTYLSWILVLFGARVTYTIQTGYFARGSEAVSTALGNELFVARVMRAIGAAFSAGAPPPNEKMLGTLLRTPEEQVRSALERLAKAKLIHSLAEDGWVPARPLERISLADVRAAAREGLAVTAEAPDLVQLKAHWAVADGAAAAALSVSMAQLIDQGSPAA
jgi:membrane protein